MGSLGISPLLATVLLIAATVVTTTMLSGWVSTTTGTTQNIVANKTNENVACAAAEIVIDDVYITAGTTSETASVILRNSGGTDDLTITSAQLYNKNGDNITTTNVPISDFDKGEIATLSFSFKPAGDSSKYGNNGTLTSGPLLTTGRYGSGLGFDGINDLVNVDNNPTINLTTAITLEAWIYPTSLSSDPSSPNGMVINKGYGTPYGGGPGRTPYDLRINGALNNTRMGFFDGDWKTVSGTTTLTANNWYHVAGTYDNGTGVMTVYVNGIQSNTTTTSGNMPTTPRPLEIGRYYDGSSFLFNGTIDDVAIWNRSLTNAEINTSMNAGPLSVSNNNDLIGYWNFDGGIVSCPTDFSKVIVTTNCGGVSAEFSKSPKC